MSINSQSSLTPSSFINLDRMVFFAMNCFRIALLDESFAMKLLLMQLLLSSKLMMMMDFGIETDRADWRMNYRRVAMLGDERHQHTTDLDRSESLSLSLSLLVR